jgi:hypothetical protein
MCLDESAEPGENIWLVPTDFPLQRLKRAVGQLAHNLQGIESLLPIARRRPVRKKSVGLLQSRCRLVCAYTFHCGNGCDSFVASGVVVEGIKPTQFDLEVRAGYEHHYPFSRGDVCEANSVRLRVAAVHNLRMVQWDGSREQTPIG